MNKLTYSKPTLNLFNHHDD